MNDQGSLKLKMELVEKLKVKARKHLEEMTQARTQFQDTMTRKYEAEHQCQRLIESIQQSAKLAVEV